MDEHERAFENAMREARIARTLAVKAAKTTLNSAIRAAYTAPRRQLVHRQPFCEGAAPSVRFADGIGNAIERAWQNYDTRIMDIWKIYYAAIRSARDEVRASEYAPRQSMRPATATIITSIFPDAEDCHPARKAGFAAAGGRAH